MPDAVGLWWHWMLFASVLLLVLLLLNRFLIPYVVKAALRARVEIGYFGIFSVHDLRFFRDEQVPMLEVQRIYFALHMPDILRGQRKSPSRFRLLSLRLDGVQVRVTPKKHDPVREEHAAQRREHDEEEKAHAQYEARLHRLMQAPQHSEEEAKRESKAERALRCVAVYAQHYAIVIAQHIAALLAAFIALEVARVRVELVAQDMCLELANIQLQGAAAISHTRRTTAVLTGMAHLRKGHRISDGFDELSPLDGCNQERAKFRLPYGYAHVCLSIDGVRLVQRSAPSNVLALLESATRLRADMRLGQALSREQLHLSLELADTVVHLGALLDILARIPKRAPRQAPKKKPARDPAMAKFLARLATVSVKLGTLKARYALSTDKDSPVLISTTLRNFSAQLGDSDPSEDVHQAWFGACGVRGYSSLTHEHTKHQVPVLIEARRVFRFVLGLESIEARMHTMVDGEQHNALLGSARGIDIWARSSYTPFGILAAAQYSQHTQLFFSKDPNEPAGALYLQIGKIRGAPDTGTIHRLVHGMRCHASTPRQAPKPKCTHLPTLPRLALVVHIDSLHYLIHRSKAAMHPSPERKKDAAILVLSLPRIHVTLQGSYEERIHEHKDQWRTQAAQDGEPPTDAPDPWPCEAYPLLYRADFQAGLDSLDLYLSSGKASHGAESANAHDDILHITTIELCATVRVPAAYDVSTWQPQLALEHTYTRAGLYVHHVDVYLYQAYVLDAISALLHAAVPAPQDAPQGEAAPPPPCAEKKRPSIFQRLPPIQLAHAGVGSVATYLAGSDPKYNPHVRRGLAIMLGQTTLDYARNDPQQHMPLADKDARTALRLPEHITNKVLGITGQHGSGAACTIVQHKIVLYPVVDMDAVHALQKGEQREKFAQAEADAWERAEKGTRQQQGKADGEEHGVEASSQDKDSRPPAYIPSQDPCDLPSVAPHSSNDGTDAIASQPTTTAPAERGEKQTGLAASGTQTLHEKGSAPSSQPEDASHSGTVKPPAVPQKTPDPQDHVSGAFAATDLSTNPSTDKPFDAIYVPDWWSFDDAYKPHVRTQRRSPKICQLSFASHFFHIPKVATSVSFLPPDAAHEVLVSAETCGTVSLRIRLLNTYCVLIMIASLKAMLPKRDKHKERTATDTPAHPVSKEGVPLPANSSGAIPGQGKRRAFPCVQLCVLCPRLHLHADLPEERRVIVSLSNTSFRFRSPHGIRVSIELLRGVVPSALPGRDEQWEEAAQLRRLAVSFGEQASAPKTIFITGDCLRIRIPCGYYTNALIQATTVSFKATKQLVFQFVKGGTGSAIYPHPEAPKKLPNISLRMRMACIEGADNPFDSRIALLYRTGSDEQLMRLERERVLYTQAEEKRQQGPDGAAPVDEALQRLHQLNASLWIHRFKNARKERGLREIELLSYIHKRIPDPAETSDDPLGVDVLDTPAMPPLVRMTMTQLCLDVSRPKSFSLDKTHEFLHEQAGNPVEVEYTTLIPLHLHWRMSECVVRLRDYPLPLLYIPPAATDHTNPGAPCFDAEGDMCIAERLGDDYSIRHVPATIVPALQGPQDAKEHGMLVPKSVLSPQIYGQLNVDVHAKQPTIFAWGQSMQPAIQDLIRMFDGITGPPHDPSPKPGPWDKLPFIFRGALLLNFAGDVRMHLKGSRDPYRVDPDGAGWVMCWRQNVELRLGFANKDKEFLQVMSNVHLLAIPRLATDADLRATGLYDVNPSPRALMDAVLHRHDVCAAQPFTKVAWQLNGGVRWGMGLVPEHTCTDETCERDPKCKGKPFYRQCRFFGRIPHWKVMMRSYEGLAKLPEDKRTDSFRGWRSDFVHLSLSITATGDRAISIEDRDFSTAPAAPCSDPDDPIAPGIPNLQQSRPNLDPMRLTGAKNCLYVTPLAWDHFKAWMALFNSALSLPIRQGSAFPQIIGSMRSPKFGRHLGTVKYRFNIAPLYVTSMYPQRMRSDLAQARRTYVGLKAYAGMFYLDMHQRMQETIHESPGGFKPSTRAFHKPFYEAEADIADLLLHCIGAQFREQFPPSPELATDNDDRFDLFGESFNDSHESTDVDPLYDPLDFVEMDNVPLMDTPPRLRIHQLLSMTRFNFHRRVELDLRSSHGEERPVKETESKFGHEDTHTCLIGQSFSVMTKHLDMCKDRLTHLSQYLSHLEAEHVRDMPDEQKDIIRDRMALVKQVYKGLKMHCDGIEEHRREKKKLFSVPQREFDHLHHALATGEPIDKEMLQHKAVLGGWEPFNNQYLVYKPLLVFTNQTRDLFMRYYTSFQQYRSFLQQLGVSEQRHIQTLLEKKAALLSELGKHDDSSSNSNELFSELVGDTIEMAADHMGLPHLDFDDFGAQQSSHAKPNDAISEEYSVREKSICFCVQPQAILHSQLGSNSTLLLQADQMRLRNYAVSDDNFANNDKNRNVLHRNFFGLKSLQCFQIIRQDAELGEGEIDQMRMSLPSTIKNPHLDPKRFKRIVGETHAYVLFDKHNQLRIDDPSRPVLDASRTNDPNVAYIDHKMDLVRVLCPKFTLTADTEQYSAMYFVVTDLLLHQDPLQKEHAEQRDSIVYSYNFNNPALAVGLVSSLQARVHHLLTVRKMYTIKFSLLSAEGQAAYLQISAELLDKFEELRVIEDAMRTAYAYVRDKEKHFGQVLQGLADSIEWNMLGSSDTHADPLMARLALSGVSFARVNLSNGTSTNSLSLADVDVRNAHPTAFFEHIITKYAPESREHYMMKRRMFLSTTWLLLPPSAGVRILDRFEFHLHPLRVQLERKVGRQIMDYLFHTHRDQQQRERAEAQQPVKKRKSWLARLVHMHTDNNALDSDSDSDFDSDTETEGRTVNDVHSQKESSMSHHSQHTADTPGASAISSFARLNRWELDDTEMAAHDADAVREEMSRRATQYASFIQVIFNEIIVSLSYKGDAEHSLTNLYDVEFQTHKLEYKNLLGSFGNLADALKKDLIRIAWHNRRSLLKGVVSTNNKRRNTLKKLRANRLKKYGGSVAEVQKRIQEINEEGINDLGRVLEEASQGAVTNDTEPSEFVSNFATHSPAKVPQNTPHQVPQGTLNEAAAVASSALDDAASAPASEHTTEAKPKKGRLRRLLHLK
ncbi:hypothetical protein MVES1_003814 [Malassezia vespertilionis]|uniref:Uncharacterized protein n=1 Tax=Malassezia vespertilionis TaxID=2020962 RepID=A0A2N1J7K9_9BASI|nr:uncharacterized protein MVES1_003814 [Malassezia vespertilionis]PKI82543.1 hypothetical protein MVES_003371 [Malassezia vespertilionis]WFD08438.1 hypothetical protein MVES1_003814 [Malassezia vespertilionis]